MMPLVLLLCLSFAGLLGLRLLRQRRKRRLLNAPPDPAWESILRRFVPPFARLDVALRRRLYGKMHVFLSDKRFEGCGGLELTEEIKVVVAAEACLLLLGREDDRVYPDLKTVLVYPEAYRSGKRGLFGGDNGTGGRLGESWGSGVVVLSWNGVRTGALDPNDGHNVVFHEFAHQLDQEDGRADGVPILAPAGSYALWAKTFRHDYERLVAQVARRRPDVLDAYGATDPAEFFAVATETFFEKPRQLRERHPELFDELRAYYALDPETWKSLPEKETP